MISSILMTLKRTLSFGGRASRKEFWTYVGAWFVLAFACGLVEALLAGSALGTLWLALTGLALFLLCIPGIALSIRRLHDVNLSGFWLIYLSLFGLPVVYVVYLLDLEPAANTLVEKIQKVGSPWLGWILTLLAWPFGAPVALCFLYLYEGKKEANTFGPSPYEADPSTTTEAA